MDDAFTTLFRLFALGHALLCHMSSSASYRHSIRRGLSALFAASIPLFTGGWIGGPQSTFDAKGPVASSQLDVFYVTLWVTGVIFVIVAAVLAYTTLKFKARSAADEHAAPPPQGHGNPLVELSLIGASVLALVFIAVPTLKAIWYTYDIPEEQREQAYEVTATGYQWWFKFEYPTEQIDGAGTLVTGNELVIPAGRPVRVNLRTIDVIHSFWVPKLAGKVDMIPNRGNHLWLQADEPGYFWGQCAEYCGESHAVMRFRVVALNEADFAAWVENQKKDGRTVEASTNVAAADAPRAQFADFKVNEPGWTPEFDADPLGNWVQKQFPERNENPALIAEGRQLFAEKACAGCHTIRGHEGVGITGPDLTHIGSRTTIAGGLLENNTRNLYRWIAEPNHVKPGNKMWVGGYTERDTGNRIIEMTPSDVSALVAYLESLK
ncbi:cytochrome c oxidase subunit II [Opitutaceae bacterium]